MRAGDAARHAGATYLEGSTELSQHVGHQVEVRATLAAASSAGGDTRGGDTRSGAAGGGASSTPGADSSGGNRGQDTAAGSSTNRGTAAGASPATIATQRLQVSSVRMISSTCSR
jgi:hypothetical protein